MKRTFYLMAFSLLFTIGVQAQSKIVKQKSNSCFAEKKDSCSTERQCPFCKDVEREKKMAKIKGYARTLPLPLDSTLCDKCKKHVPQKGTQRISNKL